MCNCYSIAELNPLQLDDLIGIHKIRAVPGEFLVNAAEPITVQSKMAFQEWRTLNRWRKPNGFTLIELLAVLGILSILAVLASRVTMSVREKSRAAVCMSHLRDIHLAITYYAADNQGDIPMADDQRNNAWWMGTISKYIEKKPDTSVYSWAERFTTEPGRYTMFCPSSTVYNVRPGNFCSDWGHYGMNRHMSGFTQRSGTGSDGLPTYQGVPQVKLAGVTNPSQKVFVLDAGYGVLFPSVQTGPGPTYTYIPGLPANKNMSWSENARKDALTGRHAGRVNVMMVDGHIESWGPKDFTGTAERWVP